MGARVVLASDGEALALLRAEFPDLPYVELPGYRVRYPWRSMVWSIAPQLPRLFSVLKQERRALDSIIKTHKIDALISDNRYGLHHSGIRTAFLSHQLHIRMPYAWLERAFERLNHRYWRRYDVCWIPDEADEASSLAGALSHGEPHRGLPLRYIGNLSRLHRLTDVEQRYDCIAVLSGPEPRRSLWERELLGQASGLPGLRMALVRGKPIDAPPLRPEQVPPGVDVFDYMTSEQLNRALLSARVVVSRSGYSSIMDLAQLAHRQAVLVPTPGQTEQEYLAQRFHQKGIYYSQNDQNFNLQIALNRVQNYTGLDLPHRPEALRRAIDDWLGA